ncbi:MAG TPA: hypothetical protein VE033_00010 [Acetobacteraceae bacterium]|jgi:hypothetical protein|nr:hypothetical protein [Acetobacteraceae bacterium]
MPDRRAAAGLLLLAALLAACAGPRPPAGEVIRAEVMFVHRPEALARNTAASPEPDRSLIERTGFAQAVREGRAVRFRCAIGRDDALVADAIVPPGLTLPRNRPVLLRWGRENPPEPNQVVGVLPEGGRIDRGSFPRPYLGSRQIVPWSSIPVYGSPEPWQDEEYAIVGSWYVLRCRAPARGNGESPA